jgi:hypothetical protein
MRRRAGRGIFERHRSIVDSATAILYRMRHAWLAVLARGLSERAAAFNLMRAHAFDPMCA